MVKKLNNIGEGYFLSYTVLESKLLTDYLKETGFLKENGDFKQALKAMTLQVVMNKNPKLGAFNRYIEKHPEDVEKAVDIGVKVSRWALGKFTKKKA